MENLKNGKEILKKSNKLKTTFLPRFEQFMLYTQYGSECDGDNSDDNGPKIVMKSLKDHHAHDDLTFIFINN